MESKKRGGVEEKFVVSMLEPRVAKQCVGVILKKSSNIFDERGIQNEGRAEEKHVSMVTRYSACSRRCLVLIHRRGPMKNLRATISGTTMYPTTVGCATRV